MIVSNSLKHIQQVGVTLMLLLLYAAIAPAAGSNTSKVEASTIAPLQSLSDAFAEIANKAKPAVVNVKTFREMNVRSFNGQDPFEHFRRFFGDDFRFRQSPNNPRENQQPRKRRVYGFGSGSIVSEDGYILTNNHVIDGADEIIVTLNDKREFEAKLIGADPDSDLAVVKIDANEKLPFLELGDSEKLRVGDWVIAVGNPLGFDNTVTAGIVSATGRDLNKSKYENYIQTDASINQGNSGGPLLNIRAEIVGINSAIASQNGGFVGIGLAIPSNMANRNMQQLIEHGKVVRGWLGVTIQDITSDLADVLGTENLNGALVGTVMKDSPAEAAGLNTQDIIIKVNDTNVSDSSNLRLQIAALPPDSTVNLLVLRGGKEKSIKVKLGERPKNLSMGGSSMDEPEEDPLNLGFEVQDLNEDLAKEFKIEGESEEGVLVVKVDPDSNAAAAGIQPGVIIEKVNQTKVSSVKEFKEVLEKDKDKDKHLFQVRKGEATMFVVVKVDVAGKADKN